MIQTKRFKLTPKELFIILITRSVKKRWWFSAWIWIAAIIMIIVDSQNSLTYLMVGFAILIPILAAIQFWRYVNSKSNKLMLHERYYEIDNDKINGILDEDTHSTIKIDHFIKVDCIRNSYLLFIAKNQFVYIPFASFESDDDRKWFETEIISKINSIS